MKSKNVAAILALFLGGLGVHRMYLGEFTLALVYLVFSCTLIPSLIALFDAIMFITMSDDAFNKKYNKVDLANGNLST